MKKVKTFDELPEDFWDFIEKNYPKYYHADEILHNDLLAKYTHDEEIEQEDIDFVKDNFSVTNKEEAEIAYRKDCIELYNISVVAFNDPEKDARHEYFNSKPDSEND